MSQRTSACAAGPRDRQRVIRDAADAKESPPPGDGCDDARCQRLEAQFHASPIPTLIWQVGGDDLTLVEINPAAAAMLHDDPGRLRGQSDCRVYRDFPDIRAGLRRCAATGERVQRDLAYPAGSTDAPRQFRMTFTYAADDLVFLHMEDLTALLSAQEQAGRRLADLLHMKRLSTVSEFAASLAHELKQPLSVLTTDLRAALWAVHAGADADRVAHLVEHAFSAAERASAVVGRTRQLVANRTQSWERADLNGIVESALAAIGPEARSAGVWLRFEAGGDLPPVEADPLQLEQVVMNLARNAIQAMRDSPPRSGEHRLTVRTEGGGASLRLRVDDTGPGLSPSQVERIFEPFYTTRREGLGMGLSICSRVVQAHGGELTCGSNPDGGARFEATLPVAVAAQQPAA